MATIHSYLCSDGMVKKFGNHSQIKFTNIEPVLLEDFKNRFKREFKTEPHFYREGHIGKMMVFNKELFNNLMEFGPYDSRNWRAPLEFLDTKTTKLWLRAFFDAEGWVELQRAKSRSVRADCINEAGMKQVAELLRRFGIESQLKVRTPNYMWRLNICGKENLEKFKKHIGFLHPVKSKLLEDAVKSYMTYEWKIPKTKHELMKFIRERGRQRFSRGETRIFSIKKSNLSKLKKALKTYNVNSKLQGPWYSSQGSEYYCLTLKEKEVK